jgi:hypothetical protein
MGNMKYSLTLIFNNDDVKSNHSSFKITINYLRSMRQTQRYKLTCFHLLFFLKFVFHPWCGDILQWKLSGALIRRSVSHLIALVNHHEKPIKRDH